MKFGVIVFPGSNCDHDCYWAVKDVLGYEACYIWHKETSLPDIDCVIIPGGFSYGDYLRCGAIARFSPVMAAVKDYLNDGGLAIGICNGFQILLEAHLLPGAMQQNRSLKFICRYVHVKVENIETPFTNQFAKGDVLRLPIAHAEGNYYADEETAAETIKKKRVLLRYCSPEGKVSDEYNPNGALNNIAGICDKTKRIFGLMPHPERASHELLGSVDGKKIFTSIAAYVETHR